MIIFGGNIVESMIAAVVCAGITFAATRIPTAAAIAGSIAGAAWDLVSRYRDSEGSVPWLDYESGGHVWFIPVWLWASAFAAIWLVVAAGWL